MGPHGRGFAPGLLMRVVLLLVCCVAAPAAQRPSPFDALLQELAVKIASVVAGGADVSLAVVAPDADDAAAMQARIASLLTARGIRVTGGSAVLIQVGCGDNLRERACVADIRGDGRDQLATVTRPVDAGVEVTRAPLAIELRPLVSQGTQILDAAVIRDRLLVLDVAAVTVYERNDDAWRAAQSRPVTSAHSWPRDVRGRIRADGDRVDLLLPGTVCSGRVAPLDVTCVDRQQSWPLVLENAGLEAGRNYFRTSDGLVFYNAASIGPDAAARWLIADRDGLLQVLSDARKPAGSVGAGDDVATVRTACAAGSFVASGSRGDGPDARDVLRLSQVSGGRMVQAASPAVLPGELTALWPSSDQASILVVTHDVNAGRYDALQASISCSR